MDVVAFLVRPSQTKGFSPHRDRRDVEFFRLRTRSWISNKEWSFVFQVFFACRGIKIGRMFNSLTFASWTSFFTFHSLKGHFITLLGRRRFHKT